MDFLTRLSSMRKICNMTARLLRLPGLLILLYAAGVAQGQAVVAEFHGSSNMTSNEFQVQAPWILNWRVTGEYNRSVGFELMLLDGKTRMLKGVVLRLKSTGNGVKLFNESGSFRFRISSGLARYHLRVEEISEDEAKLYTPRAGS
jgi:hypothetical protein